MGKLTTSYFAQAKKLDGTKISIARRTPRWSGKSVDERIVEFAPSLELLRDYKADEVSWQLYVPRYKSEQRAHYRERPQNFLTLLTRALDEDITLLCYEKWEGPTTRCHRRLLYGILQKVAAHHDIPVRFVDEDLRRPPKTGDLFS